MLYLLENRIQASSLLNPFFTESHVIFPSENSCHNFNMTAPSRIWIKWNSSTLNFTPTIISPQLISGIVDRAGYPSFTLTVIYAENDRESRSSLWDMLRICVASQTTPWIIMGDFNCCRFASDKLGGNPLSHHQLGELNSVIFDAKLMELPSVGNVYTWFNQRQSNPIHIKLDRVLTNDMWASAFPNSYYSVQAPSCSDHCPLILHSSDAVSRCHRFLFKNFWTQLDGYWCILLEVFSAQPIGNPMADFCSKLKRLKSRIKLESWANSNAIQDQLDSLHRRQLECLEQINLDPHNDDLVRHLKSINHNISKTSSLHSSWIIQRAKASWLSQGEDNLKFLYAKIRRRKAYSNAAINLGTSSNLSRPDTISDIINHFHKLFNPPLIEDLNMDLFPSGNTLQPLLADSLIFPVTDDEIRQSVFDGAASSFPGPDGFNYHFYKRSWHFIGPWVCKAVKFFLVNGTLAPGIKATALALIPKSKHASSFADFRPIALCNVIYKIVSKILASRLKPIMPLIVKETQSGFINGRISTDNIILAQELLSFANTRKKNIFCAKYDIRKAFDTVSREFVLARLVQKGIPPLFISWIKACIYD
ncbi:hypothetical protein KFK09_004885 [Dendrobium nobile]|uniref:Reverse transcriptase domain-containing protein n=1 Tax=Dendrobium nobile TaxID=94219 RepID=A0A8T3BZR2_DENNO|nr:hypothetical protein KFK09_004885 [Dendrobium nobile]